MRNHPSGAPACCCGGGASVGAVGGSSTASLGSIVASRAQFLTGHAGLSYWEDPFVVLPGTRGSCWRDAHGVDVHIVNGEPGGVVQVASNAGYGTILVDPYDEHPTAIVAPSFAGLVGASNPFYMYTRFRLAADPGTGGPGGWDPAHCSFVIGLVDATTLGVIGIGCAGAYFGAIGGTVTTATALTELPSTVARDLGVWHFAELYTASGAWWLKFDGGTAINVSALFPGVAVHGSPFVQVQTDDVLQPAVEIDHIAYAAGTGVTLAPLGPDPGGVSAVTASYPLFSSGGPTPDISIPAATSLGLALLMDTPAGAADGRALLALGTMATQGAGAVAITGGSFTGLAAPVAATDAATKAYVDSAIAGFKWKASVRAATTAAGTLATSFANGQTVDGVVLATGNRILLKNQAAGADNGIYTVNASGAPTRATDADASAELISAAMFVEEGTANADKAFVCTNNTGIVVGTTALVFTAFASVVGALVASSNLSDLASAATARTNLGLAAVAASGSASDLTSGTVPAARLPNLFPTVFASGGFSAVSSVTIPFAANAYRRLELYLTWDTSGVDGLTLTGLAAGSYSWTDVYLFTGGSVGSNAGTAQNSWNESTVFTSPMPAALKLTIEIPPAPALKMFQGVTIGKEPGGAARVISRSYVGISTDATNDPTGLVIHFAAAVSGSYSVVGWP